MQYSSMTITLPVSKRGTLTLPPALRKNLGLDALKNPFVIVEERDSGLFLQAAAALPVRDIPRAKILEWLKRDEEGMSAFRAAGKRGSAK